MQDGSQSVIGVVVVNYGSTGLLRRNLAGLAGVPGCRVVVVDNYSGEAERDRVAELCHELGWTAVLLDTNAGFGAGVNAGLAAARRAGADAYLLINPDATIDSDTLAAFHDHVRAHPLDLVAPKVLRPDGSTWSAGMAVELPTGRMRGRPGLRDIRRHESAWVSGACLAFSETLRQRVGGMPDGYFLYWEDVDFSLRVRRVGGRPVVREDLVVTHSEGGTQRDDHDRRLSNRYYFYNCRNRLVFASRQLGRRQRLNWMITTPRESWLILLRGGRRQLLHSPAPLIASVAGSLAGLGIAARSMRSPVRRDGISDTAEPALRRAQEPRVEDADASPIVALMSFPATPPKANPYRLLLERGLRKAPGLKIKYFSWRTALLGDYDVFHVHWPEILLEGSTPAKTAARRVLFAIFLARMRIRRIAIVRTMHNLELPSGIDPIEVALLRAAERQTAVWIRLNTSTELPAGRPGVTVLHGHYRDWYGSQQKSTMVAGRIVFYGLVRRYKGVPALVRAFTESPDPTLSLEVLGRPSTTELADEIIQAAGKDQRVRLRLEFVEDPELVRGVTEAELVVLPYAEMHNSAAVLTALSLDRPVLVPDNEVNHKLAAEVGPGWVHTYSGPISAQTITAALSDLRQHPPADWPDLEQRDWDLGGLQHADAYRLARRWVHRRRQ
ncbi:glycosyltransferase [Microlunatus elymi]|nr:glycosyltransferase [Microlunatus elymi]